MITKKDYFIGAVVGLLTAIFLLPTLYNLQYLSMPTAVMVCIGIPVLWVFGVWFGKFLGQWLKFFNQFGKYVVVGFFNTSINFGILNILSILTGTTAGVLLGGISAPGFLLAAMNSYFWNKFWVFKDTSGTNETVFKDLPKFALITLLGVLFNSLLIIYLTTYVGLRFGLDEKAWLNAANVAASAAILIWNFLGYKFFAFNQQNNQNV
ncbi:MAG: GtrA family protein [bacterium]|nr:GtrA family protein [bacterium]